MSDGGLRPGFMISLEMKLSMSKMFSNVANACHVLLQINKPRLIRRLKNIVSILNLMLGLSTK